jgi:3',5'-cyclic AMP phosphodiesterase CpdA
MKPVPVAIDFGSGRVGGSHRYPPLRVFVAVLLATVLAVGAFFFVSYRRQVIAYLTHWEGSPTHTEPFVPFAAGSQPELHVAVVGDIGESGARLDATAAAMARAGTTDPYDVLLLLGDNVYPAGDPDRLGATVFEPFGPVLDSGAELLAILGNHDIKLGREDEQLDALGMPGPWWAKTIGDVLFVGLDSNQVDDVEQLAFLERTLRDSTATWKFVAVHHGPYSAGYQGSDKDVRETFVPLFERYGVQLVLSGHDHDYQRSEVMNGVTYIVTGGAATTRRTGSHDFTEESFSWHHFVDLNVFDDHLVVRAVNQDLRVADEATIPLAPDQFTKVTVDKNQ